MAGTVLHAVSIWLAEVNSVHCT